LRKGKAKEKGKEFVTGFWRRDTH